VVRESVFARDPAASLDQLSLSNCQATIARYRFEYQFGALEATGGQVLVENNLFVALDGFTDNARVLGSAGSLVRFNTFVNTTATPSDGAALCFDASVTVTSNIFAYRSMHPLGSVMTSCTGRAKFSVFDTSAIASEVVGEGNQQLNDAAFFVDRAARDFRLGSTSPAREASEPGLPVDEDLAGNPRPSPIGTVPDVGALEAP
jgi:hypothetical protein